MASLVNERMSMQPLWNDTDKEKPKYWETNLCPPQIALG